MTSAARRIDAVDVAGADLARRGVALVVRVDAVARVGEPDAAVALDHDVVRRIEALAVVAIGEHRARAVDLGARHGAAAVLARDETALQVDGVAVAVHRRLAEHRHRAVRFVPAQHAIVRNVGPDEIASGREPRRAFGPAAAGIELLDVHVREREPAKARVDDFEAGSELEGHVACSRNACGRESTPNACGRGRRSAASR